MNSWWNLTPLRGVRSDRRCAKIRAKKCVCKDTGIKKCQNWWFRNQKWSTIFLKLFAFLRQRKTIPITLQTTLWPYEHISRHEKSCIKFKLSHVGIFCLFSCLHIRTPEDTPSTTRTFCWNICQNDFNFKLSWHILAILSPLIKFLDIF